MSDYFEIIPNSASGISSTSTSYNKAQQEFLTQSYGYYSEVFLTRMYNDFTNEHAFLLRHHFKKILRDTVKNFLMSDLEIVFFAYFAHLLKWNLQGKTIEQYWSVFGREGDTGPENSRLVLFSALLAHYVKSYIGDQDVTNTIRRHLEKQNRKWKEIYEEWIKELPKEVFQPSPRQINQLYTSYTKDCQRQPKTKNYNEMVEKVLELSTTYAIIPAKVERKKRDSSNLSIQRKNQRGERNNQRSERINQRSQRINERSERINERSERMESPERTVPPRKITLRNKAVASAVAVNNNVTSFYASNAPSGIEELSQGYVNYWSFLDPSNIRKISEMDYPVQSNSNLMK